MMSSNDVKTVKTTRKDPLLDEKSFLGSPGMVVVVAVAMVVMVVVTCFT